MIPARCTSLGCFLLLAFPWVGHAALRAAAVPDDEPPVAGQPHDFSGAVGTYQVSTRAAPTELAAEDTLTLTVSITGSGPAGRLPRRPDLRRLPKFTQRFHLDPSTSDRPDRTLADGTGWEFDYRLRPRSESVTAVPALAFVFYKPGSGFETVYAEPIPLRVKRRAAVKPQDVKAASSPVVLPDHFYHLVEGVAVLRRDRPPALPGPVVLAGLLLLPPVLCAGWYWAWWRRYPDAARRTWQRRSRAARHALRALHSASPASARATAQHAAAVLAAFLRERLDFPAVEPTPAEAAGHLRRAGFPEAVAAQAAEFFARCDAARFAPDPGPGGDDVATAAARLIQAVEAEPCSPATS
jgi:hypothetical protein